MEEKKSVITCDLEGRIETFGKDAEEIFGWSAGEIVGKQRVSLFSPGLVVLGHVGAWLKAARETGKHETETVFVRKDGSRFAARIKITPTFRHGEQIGYCGVTVPLDVPPEAVMPPISRATRLLRWMVILRLPFLTATLAPIFAAIVWSRDLVPAGAPFGLLAALVVVGACALHLAANLWNDHFDWTSGTDAANADYFLPFSGGSRAVELGLISARGLFVAGLVAFLVAAGVGVALIALGRPHVVTFGLAGGFLAYFYTAPPLRLAARRGLGELAVGLAFGPGLVLGAVYAMTGVFAWPALAVGLPFALLTAAILWINEIPDVAGDAATGKRTLVVVLGPRRARLGWIALVGGAYLAVAAAVALGALPPAALAALASAPLAVHALRVLWRHYADRSLIRANAATIQLHLLFGVLLGASLLF
jgi:1,4-dihydroxy-2-naphthoate octaprenyltransferase